MTGSEPTSASDPTATSLTFPAETSPKTAGEALPPPQALTAAAPARTVRKRRLVVRISIDRLDRISATFLSKIDGSRRAEGSARALPEPGRSPETPRTHRKWSPGLDEHDGAATDDAGIRARQERELPAGAHVGVRLIRSAELER